jgi:SAM-dependent methyltransferase
MYEQFSKEYDRFVNWKSRLSFELPFLRRQLQGRRRVLDVACGTGMHSLALAAEGWQVTGCDLSPAMIDQARHNAAEQGLAVPFVVAGFGSLTQALPGQVFDALLCLGNSLPHALTEADLVATLADFAACLVPEGLILLQSRNFDQVLAQRQRWLGLQTSRLTETDEQLFWRFYDFDPDGLITFHVLTLSRNNQGWEQELRSTRLHPWRQAELLAGLAQAGFRHAICLGSLDGRPFDAETSPDLVILARRSD